MGKIAIAANPASGRDIRRLVSHATVYSNREKENIVERVILGAWQMGGHKTLMMPDSFGFCFRINKHLVEDLWELPVGVIMEAQLPTMDSQQDTTEFAAYAEKENCDVMIILGGDGTSRAAAKAIKDIPIISVSTGTNNIYPEMVEGTIVGLAAAAIASHVVDIESCSRRSKRLEIYINGVFVDIALVDAVFCDSLFSSAKAVWERDEVNRVIVTQCHPASIGFSALPGNLTIVHPDDEWGAVVDCVPGVPNVKAAITAGVLSDFRLENNDTFAVGETLEYEMSSPGMIALDGEKEVSFKKGDKISIKLTRNGPLKVNIKRTLELAQKAGFFKK